MADITAAPEAKPEQTAAIKDQLAKQMREDLVRQYVDGLRARYGGVPADEDDVESMYWLHEGEINAAVARRIRAGARQPVVLRASDL